MHDAISEVEPLHVVHYCLLCRFGTQSALSYTGLCAMARRKFLTPPPPEASGRAGCGAQREQELELGRSASQDRKGTHGWGDWVSGVGHRREQGMGATFPEVVWVAGQEKPMPPSRRVWVPPLPNPCAGSLLMGLCGYEQLSSGHFFSAFFFLFSS